MPPLNTEAQRADAEIAAGQYRGPLHGIPWGAKDLLAVRDYPIFINGVRGCEHSGYMLMHDARCDGAHPSLPG